MSLLKKRFPSKITYKLRREETFEGYVSEGKSGYRIAAAFWDEPLGVWKLAHKLTLAEFQELDAFFRLVQGATNSFFLMDYYDYIGEDEVFGVGPAEDDEYQLLKRYDDYRASFEIESSNAATDTFTIEGDYSWLFSSGDLFEVTDVMLGNCAGWYLLSSVDYAGGLTILTVDTDARPVPDNYGGGGSLWFERTRTVKHPAQVGRDGSNVTVLVDKYSSGSWSALTEDTDYTVDYDTGIVTLSSSLSTGEFLRASFQYDKVVQFEEYALDSRYSNIEFVECDTRIVEVRE